MVAPSVGTVVMVRFPFTDLSDVKLRPAVVLAEVGRGDWLICQVTSTPLSDPLAIRITDSDFAVGGLDRDSYVRPAKLFCAHENIMQWSPGQLKPESLNGVIRSILDLIERSLQSVESENSA
jgi:mRNA interferase MazF